MDFWEIFSKLASEQGILVAFCLVTDVLLATALVYLFKANAKERRELLTEHKAERDAAWKAYNSLLTRSIDSTNKLSGLIEALIKARI